MALSVIKIGFLFSSYVFLKIFDLRATIILGQFISTLSLLLCSFLSDFPYILLISISLQQATLSIGSLVPFYFAMKWF